MSEGTWHKKTRQQVCAALENLGYHRGNREHGYVVDHGSGAEGLSLYLGLPKSRRRTNKISKPDLFVFDSSGKLCLVIEIEDKDNKKYLAGAVAVTSLADYYSVGRGEPERLAQATLIAIPHADADRLPSLRHMVESLGSRLRGGSIGDVILWTRKEFVEKIEEVLRP